jgi:hypothetical protein
LEGLRTCVQRYRTAWIPILQVAGVRTRMLHLVVVALVALALVLVLVKGLG